MARGPSRAQKQVARQGPPRSRARAAGLIDAARIGTSGHSFGGFTDLVIAGGPSPIGTSTDPRINAIFPMAPAAVFGGACFTTITVPTLIVGGTLVQGRAWRRQDLI